MLRSIAGDHHATYLRSTCAVAIGLCGRRDALVLGGGYAPVLFAGDRSVWLSSPASLAFQIVAARQPKGSTPCQLLLVAIR
jgi:hypothetical protein